MALWPVNLQVSGDLCDTRGALDYSASSFNRLCPQVVPFIFCFLCIIVPRSTHFPCPLSRTIATLSSVSPGKQAQYETQYAECCLSSLEHTPLLPETCTLILLLLWLNSGFLKKSVLSFLSFFFFFNIVAISYCTFTVTLRSHEGFCQARTTPAWTWASAFWT